MVVVGLSIFGMAEWLEFGYYPLRIAKEQPARDVGYRAAIHWPLVTTFLGPVMVYLCALVYRRTQAVICEGLEDKWLVVERVVDSGSDTPDLVADQSASGDEVEAVSSMIIGALHRFIVRGFYFVLLVCLAWALHSIYKVGTHYGVDQATVVQCVDTWADWMVPFRECANPDEVCCIKRTPESIKPPLKDQSPSESNESTSASQSEAHASSNSEAMTRVESRTETTTLAEVGRLVVVAVGLFYVAVVLTFGFSLILGVLFGTSILYQMSQRRGWVLAVHARETLNLRLRPDVQAGLLQGSEWEVVGREFRPIFNLAVLAGALMLVALWLPLVWNKMLSTPRATNPLFLLVSGHETVVAAIKGQADAISKLETTLSLGWFGFATLFGAFVLVLGLSFGHMYLSGASVGLRNALLDSRRTLNLTPRTRARLVRKSSRRGPSAPSHTFVVSLSLMVLTIFLIPEAGIGILFVILGAFIARLIPASVAAMAREFFRQRQDELSDDDVSNRRREDEPESG